MHVGIELAGRWHMILGKGGGVFHAQHPAVPFDRLLRILAAIGDVMDACGFYGAHCACSTSSTPRRIWSRSMLSNSALKLPSPKPSSPLRWMNSKNTGPTC